MSKELTPLEALKELKSLEIWTKKGRKTFDIIETALKRIPELEKDIEDTHKAYTMAIEKHIKDENEYIEWVQQGGYDKKKLKAFEILIEKRVNVDLLMILEDVNIYNGFACNTGEYRKLTQEEFNLLK